MIFFLLALQVAPIDLGAAPVTNTAVAVEVRLDSKGRVVSCKSATAGPKACDTFTKGRVVSSPLSKGGKPTAGLMTVSTTTTITAE